MEDKLVYLARRNPDLRAEQFPRAWREHSQFAGTFGNEFRQHFKNVTQCTRLLDAVPDSFDDTYDGANLITMNSRDGLVSAREFGISNDALKQDELRTFGALVHDWTMSTQGYVVGGTDPDGNSGDCISLSFLRASPDTTEALFVNASREQASRIATLPAAATRRIVWNEVIDKSAKYGFDAVIELWFADTIVGEQAANDPAFATALQQAAIADPTQGVRLLTRINPHMPKAAS